MTVQKNEEKKEKDFVIRKKRKKVVSLTFLKVITLYLRKLKMFLIYGRITAILKYIFMCFCLLCVSTSSQNIFLVTEQRKNSFECMSLFGVVCVKSMEIEKSCITSELLSRTRSF